MVKKRLESGFPANDDGNYLGQDSAGETRTALYSLQGHWAAPPQGTGPVLLHND